MARVGGRRLPRAWGGRDRHTVQGGCIQGSPSICMGRGFSVLQKTPPRLNRCHGLSPPQPPAPPAHRRVISEQVASRLPALFNPV